MNKVKEKVIANINDLVKDKQYEDLRDIFKNVSELDMFITKVGEYEKIKEKLRRDQQEGFCDAEVEESLLKGLKI